MGTVIIDVREPIEFAASHVEGAINITPSDVMAGAPQLQNIPLGTQLVVYCRTGSRSNVVAHQLRAMGYQKVINGINEDHVRTALSKQKT